jgi:hypothetical protein
MFSSGVVLKTPDANGLRMIRESRAQLVAKYGSATTNQKITNKGAPKPYNAPRGVPTGTVTLWKFPPNMKDKGNITIACELSGPNGGPAADPSQLQLVIRYTNETLTSAAVANTEAAPKATPVGVKKDEL